MKKTSYRSTLGVLTCFMVLPALADVSETRPQQGGRGHSPERFIQTLDKDGDQLVSFEEFSAHQPRHGMEHFNDADADGDGNVSRAEMEAALAKRHRSDEQRAAERFDETDINDDGYLTASEIKQSMFQNLDINGDGYVSGEEFEQSRASRKDGRGDRARDR